MKQEVMSELAKASPPIAVVGGAQILNLSLNEWVAVFTIGYIVLQVGYLLWQWRKASNK